MAARKQWVFDPHSGGQKISEAVKVEVAQRIQRVAKKHFKGFYIRLDIRFKGQFCYIDAFREYRMRKGGRMPKGWPETRAEFQERMRNTPVHLCRLRYFGDNRWSWAFYTYSHMKYAPTFFPNGRAFGKPEDAFRVAADVYLMH